MYGDFIYNAPIAPMLKVIVDETLKHQYTIYIAVIPYGLMQLSRMEWMHIVKIKEI